MPTARSSWRSSSRPVSLAPRSAPGTDAAGEMTEDTRDAKAETNRDVRPDGAKRAGSEKPEQSR